MVAQRKVQLSPQVRDLLAICNVDSEQWLCRAAQRPGEGLVRYRVNSTIKEIANDISVTSSAHMFKIDSVQIRPMLDEQLHQPQVAAPRCPAKQIVLLLLIGSRRDQDLDHAVETGFDRLPEWRGPIGSWRDGAPPVRNPFLNSEQFARLDQGNQVLDVIGKRNTFWHIEWRIIRMGGRCTTLGECDLIVASKTHRVAFDFCRGFRQSSQVNKLQPPDSHHLAAAKGWLELLAFDDAARELEAIAPTLREHPDMLEVRWALAANAGNWQDALAIAVCLTQLMPTKAEGWIYQGSALTELNRHNDAYAVLLQGHDRCPQDEILAYDLGCVCCALGRDDEAAGWIYKAIAMAGDEMRQRALEDPDLEKIHGRLRGGDA